MRRGFLTAGNEAFAPGVRAIVHCLRVQNDLPLAVIDHGFEHDTVAFFRRCGATIIPDWLKSPAVKVNGDCKIPARSWQKPEFLKRSPFDETVWIDADAIPVREPARILELLSRGPFLTPETYVSHEGAFNLSRNLLRAVFGKVPDHYRLLAPINAGVIGFHRGDAWVEEWSKVNAEIMRTPSWSTLCNCLDQSTLLVTLLKLNGVGPRTLTTTAYNSTAEHRVKSERPLCGVYTPSDSAVFVEQIKAGTPFASVVHFIDSPKPW